MGCNTSQESNPQQELVISGGEGAVDGDDEAPKKNLGNTVCGQKEGAGGVDDGKICTNSDNNNLNPSAQSTHNNIVVTDKCDDILEFGADEEGAAVKIQAVFRGHKVRNTMKQGDDLTSNAQASAQKSQSVPPLKTPDDPTKEELEAEFDPNDKDLCHAATRIQATFRGHMHRKIAANELKDEADLQEITKKVAEELDIDLTDPELNKAATKIQASFRGHKTRKEGPAEISS